MKTATVTALSSLSILGAIAFSVFTGTDVDAVEEATNEDAVVTALSDGNEDREHVNFDFRN
ncbi:hypothetical protein [Nesterenkonia alba]|uniref:hypothetical protein n=1 Tax=Nesterenkonia alba TaxID=515814 RepID=UPI0012EBDC62|nr:hypothetical protein [Nesterenkonia alba]